MAFLLQTALLKAALPAKPDEAPAPPSLAGELLVAASEMGDPRFERTVILIVKHDPSGALGIVINKPIGEPSIASVLEALGQKGSQISGNVRVFSRGQVHAWGIAEADPTLVFDEDRDKVWNYAWEHRSQHL
jgi:putative transcriptional regulator